MGYPHPDYLLRYLSAQQLQEWKIYFGLEPFGEYAAYLRSGIIAAAIFNANPFRQKGSKVFSPEDFMPKEPGSVKPKSQSIEEQKAVLKGIFSYAKKKKLAKTETKPETGTERKAKLGEKTEK